MDSKTKFWWYFIHVCLVILFFGGLITFAYFLAKNSKPRHILIADTVAERIQGCNCQQNEKNTIGDTR